MLQDIYPLKLFNEYRHPRIRPDSKVFVFEDRSVMLRGDGARSVLELPDAVMLERACSCACASLPLVYLFAVDDEDYFLFNGDQAPNLDNYGFSFKDIVLLRSDNPRKVCFSGFTAYHLYSWYRKHRWCGNCGHPTLIGDSRNERCLICPNCGNVMYPVISPAIIVAVTYKDKLLVTRYKDRPYRGLALVAGFCEIGETPEQTVSRELMEEVGLKVKNIRYFKSQPWGIDGNLLLGFTAELDGSSVIHCDNKELSQAFWVGKEEIPPDNDPISLTKTMIQLFKEYGKIQ